MNTTDYTRGTAETQRGLSDNQRKVGGVPPFSPVPGLRQTLFDRVEKTALARGGDLAVLLHLAQRWGRCDGYSYERIETLAAACHCSVRTMFDRERRLERCGDLYVRHRTRNHGNERLITAGLAEGEIARLMVKRMGLDETLAQQEAAVVVARRRAALGDSTSGETCNSCRFKPATIAGSLLIYESTIESSSIGSTVVDDLGGNQQQQVLPSSPPVVELQDPKQPPPKIDLPAVHPEPVQAVVQPPSPTPSPSTAVAAALQRQAERKFNAEVAAGTPKAAPLARAPDFRLVRHAHQPAHPPGAPAHQPEFRQAHPPGPTYAERKAARAALLGGLDSERLALVRELVQITSDRRSTADTLGFEKLRGLVERLPEVVEILQGLGYGGEGQPRLVVGITDWYDQVWRETTSYQLRRGYPDIERVIELLPGLGREADESLVQVWQAYAPDGVTLGGPVARPEATGESQPDEPVAAAQRVWVDVNERHRDYKVVGVEAAPDGGKPLWRVAVGHKLDTARRAQRMLERRLRAAGHPVALEFVSGAGVAL